MKDEKGGRNVFIDGGPGSGDDEESVALLAYVVAVEIDKDNGRPWLVEWVWTLSSAEDS